VPEQYVVTCGSLPLRLQIYIMCCPPTVLGPCHDYLRFKLWVPHQICQKLYKTKFQKWKLVKAIMCHAYNTAKLWIPIWCKTFSIKIDITLQLTSSSTFLLFRPSRIMRLCYPGNILHKHFSHSFCLVWKFRTMYKVFCGHIIKQK